MTRLALLFCSFLLAGCGPANDGLALQRDYLERLQRSLDAPDVSSFDNRSISQYRLPARRERFSDIPELRIGLLDLVIDARRCPRLQQLISQRNSSLGKQLMPSQRLGYEGDLLRTIDDCLPHLQDDSSLKATLQRLANDKRQQLQAVFWNALNGSPEFENYLRFADQALPVDTQEDSAALDALQRLASIGAALPAQLPPSADELEPLFFALYASEQGGQLITSLASLRHNLDVGSELLEQRQQNRPLCPLGQATPRGRILQNIFIKFYAGSLQPYLAQVDQRGQQWQATLLQLQRIDSIPAATREHLQRLAGEQDSLWQDFRTATARHVKAWQSLLNSCGLAPGQAGWNGAENDEDP
ncbi:DUF3080 domain-containing protein [Ectopseudomonas alcaliphila]|uniref:DUF3080 domain-containing protein n=1 Tax=Ectopseudomonas alcaliphila TaxID=101564 RepID=A0A1G7IZW4_9GAMM|nr:DUF3080 domain-containing protein [Pseudomonas alcaliphila]MDX5995303.1 DUF3080 domain-containing protein [Pseudomonas alcaliphila]SDF18136.1 Protein of unknown function [Pseudomonas alcaliphila]